MVACEIMTVALLRLAAGPECHALGPHLRLPLSYLEVNRVGR